MKNLAPRLVLYISLSLACLLPASAQFNSGSTGADGPLDLSTMPCSYVCTVQLPESGVLNYTTVFVHPSRQLVFRRNSRNTPVTILAQGNVTIGGSILVAGENLTPGPGGFYGGGESFSTAGNPGFGPGGGVWGSDNTKHGSWVGPLSLFPLVGGSGGSGGVQACGSAEHGGGGGGAILIASNQSIVLESNNAEINASGGAAACTAGGTGNGSGGAIRLVANSVVMRGRLYAAGANFVGNNGVIRIETNNLEFTGTSVPLAISAPINPNIVPVAIAQLTIVSVGGYTVPSYSGSRFDLIDLLLPNQIMDPVSVVVNAQNIPTGTQVDIGFVSGSPAGTSVPCNLAGSFASSSCTATVSNLNRTSGTYLLATAAFAPPGSLAQYNPKGPNHVAKVRLESAIATKPKFTFFRSNGSGIDLKDISPQFLREFGI